MEFWSYNHGKLSILKWGLGTWLLTKVKELGCMFGLVSKWELHVSSALGLCDTAARVLGKYWRSSLHSAKEIVETEVEK